MQEGGSKFHSQEEQIHKLFKYGPLNNIWHDENHSIELKVFFADFKIVLQGLCPEVFEHAEDVGEREGGISKSEVMHWLH